MSALFMGDTASMAVLGCSPWVIPLIAVAAKLTYDQTRNAMRREGAQNRTDDKEHERRDDRAREALHDGFAATTPEK
ncbi:MAG TPA: hypothetical protein VH249_05210 [Xanthobacteraceae bacterium]|jgi:hypothetical protein|nr:hypothetical protein [Xanthobacteraceae bacterium]